LLIIVGTGALSIYDGYRVLLSLRGHFLCEYIVSTHWSLWM